MGLKRFKGNDYIFFTDRLVSVILGGIIMTFPVLEGKVAIVTGAAMGMGEASLWLASDASSYLTGTTIHADAGYTAR